MFSKDTEQLEENFSVKRQNFRSMGLVILVFMYLAIGAVTFEQLEYPNEKISQKILLDSIQNFKHKHIIPDQEFEILYINMIKKTEYLNDIRWSFFSAFFFCMISVALIGYGNNTPQTRLGKLVFLIYLPFGAMLSLVSLQSIGTQINELLRQKLKHKKLLFFGYLETVTYVHLIFVETILTVVLIMTASYIFSINEEWTYFNSIYFSFITLTTIGFGDFVPLTNNSAYSAYYFGFTLLFLTCGLILVASSINLLVVYLANLHRNSLENLKRRIEKRAQMELNNILIGDVIHTKVKVIEVIENPTLVSVDEISSKLCSCNTGYKISELFANINKELTRKFMKRKQLKAQENDLELFGSFRPTLNLVNRLLDDRYSAEKEDEKKLQIELNKLAIESDFIKYRLVSRRQSL